MPALRPPEISDSTSATATAANSSGTQIPSLSPLSTLSPWRIRSGTRSSLTTAWPERRVGRRQHDAEDHRLPDGQHVEERGRGERAERDRQRQADAEQPQRHADGAAQVLEVDPRRVAEQHERERRLGQRAHGGARALERRSRRAPRGPTSSPNATNTIAGVSGVPDEPLRDRRDADERERDEREGPLHQ